MDYSMHVLMWIEDNFNCEEIEIESFPLFLYGHLITDENNDKMIVFWDDLSEQIDYKFL